MPFKTAHVKVKIDKKPILGKSYVFLSLHDNGENQMTIPSFLVNDRTDHLKIPIENWSGSILHFNRNLPIGELKMEIHSMK